MGDNHTLKKRVYTKGWLELDDDKPTDGSFTLEVDCPHCQTKAEIGEPLKFGNVYEFTCEQCKNIFVILIPDLVIKPGRIEGLLHGT